MLPDLQRVGLHARAVSQKTHSSSSNPHMTTLPQLNTERMILTVHSSKSPALGKRQMVEVWKKNGNTKSTTLQYHHSFTLSVTQDLRGAVFTVVGGMSQVDLLEVFFYACNTQTFMLSG